MRRIALSRPLVALDTETTGMDPLRDRVVEFAAVKLYPDGRRETFRTLVNPKEPIPPEASRVHGITDETVRDAPTFAETAREIILFLAGADLTGYNIHRFDLPILKQEFERIDVELPMEGVRMVDAQVIFFNREPRDLSAAVRFYCGREHTGAHGALPDSEATLDVLLAQIERYPDLPADLDGLAAESVSSGGERYVDVARRFVWRHGEAHFNFSAHKGKSLREVAESDRDKGFLKWILQKDFSEDVKMIVREAIEGKYPRRPGEGEEG